MWWSERGVQSKRDRCLVLVPTTPMRLGADTYQAPVNQVRTRVVSVPPGDAHQMVTGLPADSSFSDFVSVSEVRGTLCTKHL